MSGYCSVEAHLVVTQTKVRIFAIRPLLVHTTYVSLMIKVYGINLITKSILSFTNI